MTETGEPMSPRFALLIIVFMIYVLPFVLRFLPGYDASN